MIEGLTGYIKVDKMACYRKEVLSLSLSLSLPYV